MNANQLSKKLEQVRRKMLTYRQQWPTKAGGMALQFIDSNFRSQGWQGNTLVPWRRTQSGKRNVFGTRPAGKGILQNKGRLRASFRLKPGNQAFRVYSISKYAKVHNEGFSGTVTVPDHTRKIKLTGTIGGVAFGARSSIKTKKALKPKAVTTIVKVQSHTKQMNIPRRQFAPSATRGSNILIQQLRTATLADINRILSHAT